MQTPALAFITFTLLRSSANIVEALKCYDCHNNCYDPLPTTDCDDQGSGEWICMAEKIEPGISSLFPNGVDFKGCARPSNALDAACKVDNSYAGAWCRLCSTDLCNSAEVYTISFVLMSVVFLILNRVV